MANETDFIESLTLFYAGLLKQCFTVFENSVLFQRTVNTVYLNMYYTYSGLSLV